MVDNKKQQQIEAAISNTQLDESIFSSGRPQHSSTKKLIIPSPRSLESDPQAKSMQTPERVKQKQFAKSNLPRSMIIGDTDDVEEEFLFKTLKIEDSFSPLKQPQGSAKLDILNSNKSQAYDAPEVESQHEPIHELQLEEENQEIREESEQVDQDDTESSEGEFPEQHVVKDSSIKCAVVRQKMELASLESELIKARQRNLIEQQRRK